MPAISVIMPVYNAGPYVGEAIESILKQNFTDFEFLIYNDGSTDNSKAIITSYADPRIRFFDEPRNIGYTSRLNQGLIDATGIYIARMDSDDVSLPDRLGKQIQLMDASPDIVVCGSRFEFFGNGGSCNFNWVGYFDPDEVKINLLFDCAICHPSVMMRKEALEKGQFRYREQFEPSEDYELWVRLSKDFKLVNLDEVLLLYRVNENQVSQLRNEKQREHKFQILRRQLSALGITASAVDLRIHDSLFFGSAILTADYLPKVQAWIKLLITQNNNFHIYQPEKLERYLDVLWQKNLVAQQSQLKQAGLDTKFLYLLKKCSGGIQFDNQVMTIALVTPFFPDEETLDSGIANHCLLLAESLAELQHQIVVIHIRPAYGNEKNFTDEYLLGRHIVVLTYRVSLSATLTKVLRHNWAARDFALKIKCMFLAKEILKKAVARYKIEVVETSSYYSLSYFFIRRISRTVPVAVRVSTTFLQIMNEYYPFSSRLLQIAAKMEIKLLKKCRFLLTHASSHAQELQLLYGLPAAAFKIIPHGIRLPILPGKKSDSHRPFRVLFVGRLEYRKGIDVLLAAIPILLGKSTDILFEIIGNDTGNEYQHQFTKKHPPEIYKRVAFRGKTSAEVLENAYRGCDIFVAPSRYESFGLIFIEAMSYGKPVIGCDVGGVSQIISDEINGLFAEAGNPESLAKAIGRLIADPALRSVMGTNARKTVEQQFTGSRLAHSSADYYRDLIHSLQ